MANATTVLRPFRRDSRSFKNDRGEQVEYFEVHAIDEDGKYVVVRAGKKEPLAALEVGKVVEFQGEVRAPIRVEVTLMRPEREQSDEANGTW